jgi:hypothetical protein
MYRKRQSDPIRQMTSTREMLHKLLMRSKSANESDIKH